MNLPPQIVKTLNSSIPTRILCNIFSLGRHLCCGKWKTPTCCLLFLVFSYHPDVPFYNRCPFFKSIFHNLSSQKDREYKLNFFFNQVLFPAHHTGCTSLSEQERTGAFLKWQSSSESQD